MFQNYLLLHSKPRIWNDLAIDLSLFNRHLIEVSLHIPVLNTLSLRTLFNTVKPPNSGDPK